MARPKMPPMGGMGNMSNMIKQAQKMQQDMLRMQEELEVAIHGYHPLQHVRR